MLWNRGNHKVLSSVKPSAQNVTSEVLLPILMLADTPWVTRALRCPGRLRLPQTSPPRSLAHTLVRSSTRLTETNLMTACFVVQFGPVCLAAADTRISLDGRSGLPPPNWDSADLPLTTAVGLDHVIPYRFRKIRQLHRGWAVEAGCYVTGARMLNLLNREQPASADDVAQILNRSASAELTILEDMPDAGHAYQLYNSYLLGVPANSDRTGV